MTESTTQASDRPFAPSERAMDRGSSFKVAREFGPTRTPATPPQLVKLLKEGTVTVFFPKKVLYTLPGYKRVEFGIGVQDIPKSLANDAYLLAHGMSLHKPTEPVKPSVDLDKMTKAELLDHAKEVHDLDLDIADKKEDLIAQIEEAVTKPGV